MTAVERLDAIEARAAAAAEGPWRWRNTGEPYLMGAHSRVVMAFSRMGMQGAQPQFRDERNILRDAGGQNLNDFPDATFITHARQDLPALTATVRAVLDYADRCDVVGRAGYEDDNLKVTHRQVAEELRDLVAAALAMTS